ncbi:MAG TPA: hypothetical protein DIT64_12140, partial [Verrucomicrobiales bacterium]|nr:hypothetical protein [Verrucomicrobiales bacterium]
LDLPMSLFRKRILPTLAVLVVACAQVFGVQRGYACAHGDAPVETKAEHCHRVIVDDHAGKVPCEESSTKDSDDKGEKEHHTPLSVDMQAAPSSLATVSIPAFVAVLVAETWVHDWVQIQARAEDERLKTPLDTGGESPPSASVQVARCMVILV